MSDDPIRERVVSTAERIEEMESPDDLEPLEVRVTAGIDGTAREFVAVLTAGGPHIKVNITTGTVTGHWSGDSHTTHVRNPDVLDRLQERYEQIWLAASTQV